MPCITLSSGLRLNLAEEAFEDPEKILSLYKQDDERLEEMEKDLKAKIGELGENHPSVFDSYNELGTGYSYRSMYDRAIEYLQKALAILSSIPDHNYSEEVAVCRKLGEIYRGTGDVEKALEYYQRCFEVLKTHQGEDHLDTKKAEAEVEELKIDRLARTLGEDHPDLALPYHNLGNIYLDLNQDYMAKQYYEKSLKIRLDTLGPDHPDVGKTYNNLGLAYTEAREYDRAIECFQKSLEIVLKANGNDRPCAGRPYHNLGQAYARKGEHERAIEYYLKALDIWLKTPDENLSNLATAYANLGLSCRYRHEDDRAIDYYQKALKIRLDTLGPDHPDVGRIYNNLGLACTQAREYDRALEYLGKAREIRQEALGTDHPDVADVLKNMAAAYEGKGEYDRAALHYQFAMEKYGDAFGQDNQAAKNMKEKVFEVYRKKGETLTGSFRFDGELVFLDKDSKKKKAVLKIEIPETREELNTGLSDRTELADNQGMLYIYDPEELMLHSTQGDFFPLDMIFADKNGTIFSMSRNNPAFFNKLISSGEPGRYGIEAPGGFCDKNDIQPGDKIKIIRRKKKK